MEVRRGGGTGEGGGSDGIKWCDRRGREGEGGRGGKEEKGGGERRGREGEGGVRKRKGREGGRRDGSDKGGTRVLINGERRRAGVRYKKWKRG